MTIVMVTIDHTSTTFVVAETNAPQRYDHGSAIELYGGTYDDQIERYVLVPADALEWQRGRNASGLHTLVTEDLLLDARAAEEFLWKRLYGKDA